MVMDTCRMRDDGTTANAMKEQMGRLDGKVALITGAAGGIGRVAAELFAREGARVVIADVVEVDGKAAVDAISDAGRHAAFVHADVSDPEQADAMVRFALDTFGGLHVLYNNAGVFPVDDGGVLETPEATWERVMAINLKGVWLGCRAGIPAMVRAVGARTRVVFLGNPNNPTGTIFRRPAWEAFLAAMPDHVVVVADDAYAEYVADDDYPDTIRVRGDGKVPVVTLRTFSKLYGLAGLRVGYAVAPPAVIDVLGRVRQPFSVNSLAQVAACAALDDDDHVRRTLAANRAGMAYLTAAFDRLGLAHVPSAANFILVHVGDGGAVYQALLRRGVIVRPMDVYGFPAHVRVTVGLPEENARFVDALGQVLADTRR